jgi:hypothetical protein
MASRQRLRHTTIWLPIVGYPGRHDLATAGRRCALVSCGRRAAAWPEIIVKSRDAACLRPAYATIAAPVPLIHHPTVQADRL